MACRLSPCREEQECIAMAAAVTLPQVPRRAAAVSATLIYAGGGKRCECFGECALQ
jgi:hypothetical protein